MKKKTETIPIAALTMAEMIKATGYGRGALMYQLKHKYWRYKGAEGARKLAGAWFFHPAASLVFPERRPGPGRPKKKK